MTQEREKAEIARMVEGIKDEKLKTQVKKALDFVDDPPRHLLVAYGIARARECGYRELALKLARLAYAQHPIDPYFLIELCDCLGQPREVISEIEIFNQRVGLDLLSKDQKQKVMVALAAAYKEMGETTKSIQILEEAEIELPRGIEMLAEQYHQTGQPEKAFGLLGKRLRYMGTLSQEMIIWLGKSFDALKNYAEAADMLAQFQESPVLKPLYDEVAKKAGIAPGSQVKEETESGLV